MIRPAGVFGRRITPRAVFNALTGLGLVAVMAWGGVQVGHGLYIKAKASLAQVLLERAWAQTLDGTSPAKPWPWADTWPVAKIDVPRLGQSAIVLAGASGEAMAFGPGLVAGTPIPGERGTAVIAAHRDTHFRFLQNVIPGDAIRVTTADGRTHVFTVTGTAVVNAGASGIEPWNDGRRLALVTCYPFGALTRGPLRYVVFSEKAEGPAL